MRIDTIGCSPVQSACETGLLVPSSPCARDPERKRPGRRAVEPGCAGSPAVLSREMRAAVRQTRNSRLCDRRDHRTGSYVRQVCRLMCIPRGGGGGIRTHGGFHLTRFPSVPIRPLSHPSSPEEGRHNARNVTEVTRRIGVKGGCQRRRVLSGGPIPRHSAGSHDRRDRRTCVRRRGSGSSSSGVLSSPSSVRFPCTGTTSLGVLAHRSRNGSFTPRASRARGRTPRRCAHHGSPRDASRGCRRTGGAPAGGPSPAARSSGTR
jgi:hypothetical protein